MSERSKRIALDGAIIVALLTALAAVAREYFVTPVQLDNLRDAQGEIRIEVTKIRNDRSADHDLLQRIDERSAQIQRDISDLKTASRTR